MGCSVGHKYKRDFVVPLLWESDGLNMLKRAEREEGGRVEGRIKVKFIGKLAIRYF